MFVWNCSLVYCRAHHVPALLIVAFALGKYFPMVGTIRTVMIYDSVLRRHGRDSSLSKASIAVMNARGSPGVLTDTAGFACACWRRGVPLPAVRAVDAAIREHAVADVQLHLIAAARLASDLQE